MKTIIEPFKIKSVEPIAFTTCTERKELIRKAFYNPFLLSAKDVTIDLLTDSGTNAMSSEGWAGIMRGDESYAGARSWYFFESTVKDVFGFKHIIPTHQGRAAERILFGLTVKPGSIVPNNTHFDTTRANIEFLGGKAVDLCCKEGKDPAIRAPFKGNMDLKALEKFIRDTGPEKIPLVMMTITNNSGGGQPVSMENIKGAAEIAHRYGLPFYIDACRFSENAYFIKLRESGYSDKTVQEIVKELFSYADGCTMSAKKDAFANIGGFLCSNDKEVAERQRELLILTEGYSTYGGMAGRDLEAVAVGLREVLDESYLQYRIRSTAYVGEHLEDKGVPVMMPTGGHAVYIDARRFLPHIDPLHYPGWVLSVEMYIEAGIRAVEIGTVMFGYDPATETERPAKMDLVRLAIPRRVYTQSHMDYVVEAIEQVYQRRNAIQGFRIIEAPKFLRHFSAKFERISSK